MNESSSKDRLKPFLLDRLTDDDALLRPGSNAGAGGKSAPFSSQKYRTAVLRDLKWLLNSHAMSQQEQIDLHPLVADSVVNFGLPDLAKLTISTFNASTIEKMIVRAIERFEPRILPNTLTVELIDPSDDDAAGMVTVEITGEIWALPSPEAFRLRTEIDCGIGNCALKGR